MPWPVHRGKLAPLYYQIQQKLLRDIASGKFRPGHPLPSEPEIARQAGVSRMTARQALKALRDMGVTYTVRGKGTFASAAKLVKDFRQVQSFTEEMRARGLEPRTRLLSLKVITPGPEVARALHLEPEQRVVRLVRLRLANSSPMGIESSHLPERLCPEMADKFQEGNSLYEFLDEHYGLRVVTADEVVEASPVRAKEAHLLNVAPGAPVFLFTRTSYLEDGHPAEYVKSVYRADRYKIAIRLTRQEQPQSPRRQS